jgi:hypothetical protein
MAPPAPGEFDRWAASHFERRKKFMQYRILADTNAASLSARIQSAIDDDWELQGGVAVALAGKEIIFAQAISNQQDVPAPVPNDDRGLLEILRDALGEDAPPD